MCVYECIRKHRILAIDFGKYVGPERFVRGDTYFGQVRRMGARAFN